MVACTTGVTYRARFLELMVQRVTDARGKKKKRKRNILNVYGHALPSRNAHESRVLQTAVSAPNNACSAY